MSRHLFRIIALVMAIGLQSQAARAQENTWGWLFGHQDPRLTVAGIGVGLGMDAAYLGLRHRIWYNGQRIHPITELGAFTITTIGCGALFPIIGTIAVNRPLTPREVYMGLADCVVPFIGGWVVDASLPHTAWIDGTPMRVHARRHHHRG